MKSGDWFKRFLGADKEQQDVLKRFFKEETTWCPEHVGWQLVAAICLFVSVPVSCFPYQVLMEDWDAIWSVFYAFELMGLLLYMKKYTSFMEDQREKQIYDILEFLPVSGWQLSLFRMNKLMRLCGLFSIHTAHAAVHAAATWIFLWFAAEPMLEKLDRIKVKYGLIE